MNLARFAIVLEEREGCVLTGCFGNTQHTGQKPLRIKVNNKGLMAAEPEGGRNMSDRRRFTSTTFVVTDCQGEHVMYSVYFLLGFLK
jgi:hypothetical protein